MPNSKREIAVCLAYGMIEVHANNFSKCKIDMSYLPCSRRYLALARDRRSLFPKRARSFLPSLLRVHGYDERYTTVHCVLPLSSSYTRRASIIRPWNLTMHRVSPRISLCACWHPCAPAYQPKENQTSVHSKRIFRSYSLAIFPLPLSSSWFQNSKYILIAS